MSTEERVRSAAEAMGDTVRHIRPLPLHPDTVDFRAPAKPAQPSVLSRWQGWLVPLAGAAAVVAVAATLVAVRGSAGGATASHATSAATSTSAASSTGTSNGIPPYYVVANDIDGTATNKAGVIDTRTGALLATFKLPVNQAWGVAASASDDTFVVNRGPGGNEQSYEMDVLRVPASDPAHATMTPLKLAVSFNYQVSVGSESYTQNQVQRVAVSPDGQTVAVLYERVTKTKTEQEQVPQFSATPSASTTKGTSTTVKVSTGKVSFKTVSVLTPALVEPVLQTFSLTTGQALRTWTEAALDPGSFDGYDGLTWLADGHTIEWTTTVDTPSATPGSTIPTVHFEFELLNTTTPGTSLTANSRLVFHILDNTACEQPLVTSDGKSVICGDANNNKVVELVSYSMSTGKLERVIYQYKGTLEGGNVHAVWAPSGSLAIGTGQVGGKQGWSDFSGVMTQGALTPLPTTHTESAGLSGAVF